MSGRVTRRDFLRAAGAVAAGLSRGPASSLAATDDHVRLRLRKRVIEVSGRAADMLGIEGPLGFRGIEAVVGDTFRVEVINELSEDSLIHWHGLTPPVEMDGVPMLPRPPIAPGRSVQYEFPNFTAGTHWMHSHVGLQEQRLLAAPLIIRETAKPLFDELEHVVMLHDFTFRDPDEILAELRGGRGLHASHAAGHTHEDGGDARADSRVTTSTVLNDVRFDAYLANERTLADPEVITVEKGRQIRLRIINAAAASNLWIDTDALEAQLIAVDGHSIRPVAGRRFPLAIAQRSDLRIRLPDSPGAWPILFRPEGVNARTGIILATPGAAVTRVSVEGEPAPPVDLDLETQLEALAELPDEPVTRTEIVTLTGGGSDYSWGLNGRASMHDTVLTVREGDRIEVTMSNLTNMAHPMHLHGHYFRVVAVDGQRIKGALRDTVLVPPGQSVTIMFDATNPGTWAFHCHHLYHMNAGMMGAVAYARAA